MDDYERVLLVKPDVMVYKIPPRVSNRAYRASDWNLDNPDWNCRLRLIAKGDECCIKLDEKSTGQFFGKCPIDKYPGPAVESVSDSSRYFVLRLVNEQTSRTAFVGIGFVDRSDSFDLNVALQDHFKWAVQLENKGEEIEENIPKLDLKFKEGETIKVNLNIGTKSGASKPRPKPSNLGKGMGILLPPPPSSLNKSSSANLSSNQDASSTSDHSETTKLYNDLDSLNISNGSNQPSFFKFNKDENSGNIGDIDDSNQKSESNDLDDWADFVDMKSNYQSKTTMPDSSDNSPFSNKESKESFGNDLQQQWSDFTSCNTPFEGTSNTQISSATNTCSNNNKFDDWAKFS